MNTQINDRIKTVRQALGMTQTEFANGLGWSRGVVANLESYATEAKDLQLGIICKVYHVSKAYLTSGIGEMFPPQSLGDEIEEIAASAAKQNVEAVRKFFRELGDEFSDAEILFLYEIYKNHFCKKED